MRELSAYIRAINVRQHNEIALKAGFHGIKIPFKTDNSTAEIKLTPEQDQLLKRGLKQAQERKSREFRQKGALENV
jgi:hypothetical protein